MKASIVAASVALVGSVAASQHKAHAGFHMRRGGYAEDEVCTVYTTVYATAMPSMVANSTMYAPSPAPETSTSCTEEKEKPVHTIYTPSSTMEPSSEVYSPSPVPESSKPAYPTAPMSSKSAYPVHEPSMPAYPNDVHESSMPAYPAVPESSKPAYPEVPASSKAYTPAPKPSSSAEKPAYTPVPSSTKAAHKPKPTGGSYDNTPYIVTNDKKWAITYTPYANSGDCKTSEEIKSDIKKISELGFTTIRSYSTDCGVFEYVVPECQKYGLKVIYGIFLEAGDKGPFSQYANDQLNDIKEKAHKDSVAMVIVGNECIFNGNCEVGQLGSYIDYVRKELQNNGFPSDVAVTTTETVGIWEEYGASLCAHIDVFTVQVHPYFTQSVSAEEAGDFAAQQLEQAAKVCPEAAAKGKYITEIGWPSAGTPNGKAVAGIEEQKIAMHKIQEKVGSEACLFSFQNDGWKDPGNLDVEQSFGCVEALFY
ncbi:glycoside hydrolase [Decorospora gaudefroyi]|uniref:Probable beta-glucosidase btgE n=1 Tax=Decorospora gaudefroyi TaxID=184978 RepID=A0A6A5K8J0_9PLEO|nr:glycoside hydrolase [Decorospora gaudefroyi]